MKITQVTFKKNTTVTEQRGTCRTLDDPAPPRFCNTFVNCETKQDDRKEREKKNNNQASSSSKSQCTPKNEKKLKRTKQKKTNEEKKESRLEREREK